MNEQGAVPLNSKQALEHEQSSRPPFQTTKSFESVTTKPNSYTLDKPSQGAPRLPPTAMVAPLVGSIPSIARPLSSSTTTSPSCSPRHGLQRMNYGIETSLSSPSLDRVHEKASMSSPSKTQIQSLKTSLSERGQLIERQQSTISRLQHECREKESELRKLRLLGSSEPFSSDHSVDTVISAPVKIDMLSRKLDSLYYELDRNKEELTETISKLKEQEKVSADLVHQLDQSRSHNTTLEQKQVKLQGYLGNMPTMEEHYSLKDEVTSLTAQCNRFKKQVETGSDQLTSLREALAKKDDEIRERLSELAEIKTKNHDLEARTRSLDNRLLELHSENSQLKTENRKHLEDNSRFEARLRGELTAMRERHHLRFRDATAKLREQHKEVVKRNRLLEKQLLKSSDAMSELNSELHHKQGMVGELKSSVSTLVGENQGLLQQNMVLQAEAVRSTQSSPADTASTQKLIQEISLCVDDFDSLVVLVSSMIEGQDPSSSMLLGVKGIPENSANALHNYGGEWDTHRQLELVHKLRADTERMRSVVTERYADQIANDCTVQ